MPEPSRWLRQHHGLEPPALDLGAWRPYWRIRTRLDRLLLDGAITPREWRTALRLRTLYEAAYAAMLPIHRVNGVPHGGLVSGPAARTLRRADAMAQIQQVSADLGSFALALLEICLVDDVSWAYLGQRLGIDPKTARAWTIVAIRALNTTSGGLLRAG